MSLCKHDVYMSGWPGLPFDPRLQLRSMGWQIYRWPSLDEGYEVAC